MDSTVARPHPWSTFTFLEEPTERSTYIEWNQEKYSRDLTVGFATYNECAFSGVYSKVPVKFCFQALSV